MVLAGAVVPSEKSDSRRLFQRFTASWALVAGVLSPLITGYHYLARRNALPVADAGLDAIALIVNMLLLMAAVGFTGAFVGVMFVCFAKRDRELILVNILGGVFAALLFAVAAYGVIEEGDRSAYSLWLLIYFGAILCGLLSPLSNFIAAHQVEVGVAVAALSVATMALSNDGIKQCWHIIFEVPDFRMFRLSEMTWRMWCGAVIGASGYVYAYYAFQQWRTGGRWLDKTKEQLRGRSDQG